MKTILIEVKIFLLVLLIQNEADINYNPKEKEKAIKKKHQTYQYDESIETKDMEL